MNSRRNSRKLVKRRGSKKVTPKKRSSTRKITVRKSNKIIKTSVKRRVSTKKQKTSRKTRRSTKKRQTPKRYHKVMGGANPDEDDNAADDDDYDEEEEDDCKDSTDLEKLNGVILHLIERLSIIIAMFRNYKQLYEEINDEIDKYNQFISEHEGIKTLVNSGVRRILQTSQSIVDRHNSIINLIKKIKTNLIGLKDNVDIESISKIHGEMIEHLLSFLNGYSQTTINEKNCCYYDDYEEEDVNMAVAEKVKEIKNNIENNKYSEYLTELLTKIKNVLRHSNKNIVKEIEDLSPYERTLLNFKLYDEPEKLNEKGMGFKSEKLENLVKKILDAVETIEQTEETKDDLDYICSRGNLSISNLQRCKRPNRIQFTEDEDE